MFHVKWKWYLGDQTFRETEKQKCIPYNSLFHQSSLQSSTLNQFLGFPVLSDHISILTGYEKIRPLFRENSEIQFHPPCSSWKFLPLIRRCSALVLLLYSITMVSSFLCFFKQFNRNYKEVTVDFCDWWQLYSFYKVPANTKLVNTKPLLLRDIQIRFL